mgnify:FL=1
MNNRRNVSLQCLQTALKLMPTHFAFRLALSIFMAVLPLLGMSMSRSIYSYVEASSNSPQVLSALVFPLSMYAIYLILTKTYTVYYQRVAVQFGAILTFEKKIKLLLHKKTGEIDMRFYEDPTFYNSLWEAKVASTNIYRVAECLIEFISISVSILVLSSYAASIKPLFFVFIFLTAMPSLSEQVCEGILRSKRQKELAIVAKEERTRWEHITNIESAKERIVFGNYPLLKAKWLHTTNQFQEIEFALDRKLLKLSACFALIRLIAIAGIYVSASWFYYIGNIDYADFITTISVALFLQAQYGELFEVIGYYSEFTTLVKPYFKFMEIKSDFPSEIACDAGTIQLKNVEFSYPTSSENVLQNIDLLIHPGDKIAIVGVNGAGKSTLAKILSGLLHPTAGVASGLQSRYTRVMLQDFQCYALTKDENIALSEIHPKDPSLIRSLSELLDIADIPSGEILGREFGHRDISGGQWQKIAMARLFYHQGSVLILDEPTSAIDPLYEKRLNEIILQQATPDTTLIVISHRLSISKLLNYVYVMDNGRIIEEGRHSDLLQSPNSVYRQLWEAQTSWYK